MVMIRDIEDKKLGEILIVQVHLPSATLDNAKRFKEYLARHIEDGQKKIVVDFSSTQYMDSTFLGSLVFGLKKVVPVGGDIKLVINQVDSPIWTMFETTRMFKVFKTYSDIGTAVKSYD